MIKIYPLGCRGVGSYATYFDSTKYSSLKKAMSAHDFVVVDFMRDEEGTKYFKAYHSRRPADSIYRVLNVQHFPFGIDYKDDELAQEMFKELLV